MQRLALILFLMLVVLSPPAFAIEDVGPLFTLQAAATANGNGTPLRVRGYTSVAVQVTISGTATVTFQATADGSTYDSLSCTATNGGTASTTATATGLYQCTVAGMSYLLTPVSSCAGCAVTVTGQPSTSSARSGTGSGVGGGLASTDIDTCTELAAIWTDETGTCGGPVLSQGPTIADLVMTGSANIPNSTSLPGTCSVGNIYVDTDATSGQQLYLCESTDTWILQADGVGAGTLDQAFDGGKTINGATSLANAMCVGDGPTATAGTREVCLYGDATLGPVIRPRVDNADTNTAIRCWTNKDCIFYDVESGAAMLTIDPDAASVNAMYQFGANYRPRKAIWFDAAAASVDGTQCAAPTESANTLVKTWTIVCADNDAGAMYWKVGMPDSWDGGTVTFELQIHQVGASTNAIQIDFAAMCYSHDEAISAFAAPPTGEQPADITLTADNDVLHATTAAVTVAGTTCAGGDTLFVTGQVDATASHADIATAVEILGVKMEYSTSSLSD